jgi:DNA-binding transcriptional ArsR family regulator
MSALQRVIAAIVAHRRRAMLRRPGSAGMSGSDIALGFDVSQSGVSQRLKVLAEAGLVTVRRPGWLEQGRTVSFRYVLSSFIY